MKYLPDKDKLSLLIKRYEQNIEFVHHPEYDETSVRVDYINNFFEILGWDISNRQGFPQPIREVIHEASVTVDEDGKKKNKRPDYCFQLDGKPQFFVEAKKPSVNILESKEPAFQIRRYGWSAGMEFGVLTNFEYLIIYDTTTQPILNDNSRIGRVAEYHYTEYLEKLEEIALVLSKVSVKESSVKIDKLVKMTTFDDYFLEQIQRWRLLIAENIFQKNKNIIIEDINIFVQRFLNKSLFLRICEDKNLEKYHQLLDIESYEELKSLFKRADKQYNSGIFSFIEDSEIECDFEIFSQIYKELYFPNSSYDFSVVPPAILAKVYDIFLSEEIVCKDEQLLLIRKPEVTDSIGAITTPKEIADQIARNSIDLKLSNGDKSDISELKIIDICCGSGVFLLSAFEYLVELETLRLIESATENVKKKRLIEEDGTYRLSFSYKKQLIKDTLFGIDIDPSAIEVCKFSLLLECISDISIEEFTVNITKGGLLPNLDSNIIFGNSLVDEKIYRFAENEGIILNEKDIEVINPLETREPIFKNKYDIVIGNPPYIRVQKMNKYSPIEYKFLKSSDSNFELRTIGALDKYYLFIERSLNFLNENGICGYIVPNKFIHEKNGNKLRKYLSEKKILTKIINFNEIQLFPDVSTYVCIIYLNKQRVSELQYTSVTLKNTEAIIDQLNKIETYNLDNLDDKPWQLFSHRVKNWHDNLDQSFKQLSEVSDIFVGVQTSKDPLFYIEPLSEDESTVRFEDIRGIERVIEKGILRKSIHDVQLFRYKNLNYNKYIIYPYILENQTYRLLTVQEISNSYPNAYDYLFEFKETFLDRNINGLEDNELDWFRYGRNQSIAKFDSGETLIWSVLTLQTNVVYSPNPIVFTGGGNGPYYGLKMKEEHNLSIKYIQAVLNCKFISRFIEESSVYFRGGYFSTGKQFMERVPIKLLDLSNKEEKNLHDTIVRYVEELEKINNSLSMSLTRTRRTFYNRQIHAIENKLNLLIEKMYGVGN